MAELVFLIQTLASFVLGLFLLRLLFQVQRVDFRNAAAQGVVRLTNPVIRPLRRFLPAFGRIDTASVVALLGIGFAKVAALVALEGVGYPGITWLMVHTLLDLMSLTLSMMTGALLLFILLSWLADGYNPIARLVADVTEPLLRPFRRALPVIQGIDFSPMLATLVLVLLQRILAYRIGPLLDRLIMHG
jgi:YggT family protein